MREVDTHSRRNVHDFATTTAACASRLSSHPDEPLLAYYATPTPTHMPPPGSMVGPFEETPPRELGEFGLQVVGTPESIGEVILLKTLTTILAEWGVRVTQVRINALGDKDSKTRFSRELGLYVRKHAHHFDEECRGKLAENPYAPYQCHGETCRQVMSEGPRAMNFLSEKSRSHFRQVLEHLEGLSLPYQLDDLLIGDDRDPRLAFALDTEEPDQTLLVSVGGRYDDFVRRTTGRKEGSSVGASIYFRKKGLPPGSFSAAAPARKPHIYFVQLGLRAKLQSLTVLDLLRGAGVPVLQSFDSSRLAPQLSAAREQGVSHLIIMGQREALDGTVIVRAMNNSSQHIVALTALPRFLKALK